MMRRSATEERDEVRGVLHHGLKSPLVAGLVHRTRASSTRPSASVSWAAMRSRIARRSNGRGRSWAKNILPGASSRFRPVELGPHRRPDVRPDRLAAGEPERLASADLARARRVTVTVTAPDQLGPGGRPGSPRRAAPVSVTMQPMTPRRPDGDDGVDTGVPHVRARQWPRRGARKIDRSACSRRALTAWARARPVSRSITSTKTTAEALARTPASLGTPTASRHTMSSGAAKADDAQKGERRQPELPWSPGLFQRQLAHGRVKCRRAPAHVEEHPAQVGRTAHLPRSVQLDPAVGAVGDQQSSPLRSPRGVATCSWCRLRTPGGRVRTTARCRRAGRRSRSTW